MGRTCIELRISMIEANMINPKKIPCSFYRQESDPLELSKGSGLHHHH